MAHSNAEIVEEDVTTANRADDPAVDNLSITKDARTRLPAYIVGGVVVLALIIGVSYWFYARQFESTDDAYVEGNIIRIAPKVSAHIAKINFKENQFVKKGDVLIELDAREIENKLAVAQANLQSAMAASEKARAGVSLTEKTAGANLKEAASNFDSAKNTVDEAKIVSDSKQNAISQARNQVVTAEANLRQAQAEIPSAEAGIEQAKAQIESSRTAFEVAREEYTRAEQLHAKGDISKQGFDRARRDWSQSQADFLSSQKQVDIAEARLNSLRRQTEVFAAKVSEAKTNVTAAENDFRQSQAQINSAQTQAQESAGRLQGAGSAPEQVAVEQSNVTAAQAQIQQAEAAVRQAELELSYTKIVAPEDGFVTGKAVQEGQLVQVDQPLVAVSQAKSESKTEVWVIANFKETQIGKIKPGQTVDIYVDAYPNVAFTGKVDSFQAGTGSRFSVFPSENASGNFVKVVQRIPVKIVFISEDADKLNLLVPGMSVVPKIRVR